MKLLILFLLIPMVPIPRNTSWNTIVMELKAQDTQFRKIEKYMKYNERKIILNKVDYRIILDINKLIESNQRINKELKNIRDEIGGRHYR